jgi:hypothetical protein
MGLQNRFGCVEAKQEAARNARKGRNEFDKLQIPDNVLRIPSPALYQIRSRR